MQYFFLFLCLSVLSGGFTFADTEIELAPITKLGSPGDVLTEDSIVPAVVGNTQLNSGAGDIQNSLQNQMAIPMTRYGKAGGVAQVRGFGSSAEDVDIQALGMSLNPPQGGGFDLSIFPQFLWSGFRFQGGPALSSFNQTALAGTLSLSLWTDEAVRAHRDSSSDGSFGDWKGRAVEFYSSLGVNQLSAAVKKDRTAMNLGYSAGQVIGPSGSLSQSWSRGSYSGAFHLLMTNLDAETPGPDDMPTPRARLETQRWIPVLQSDFRFAENKLLKTSLFFDGSSIFASDPDISLESKSATRQGGFESVFLHDQWKWGLSYRQIRFFSDFFDAPIQNIGNFQVSRLFERGSFTLEPTLQAVWMTGFGFVPQGSLGGRWDWSQGQSVFVRGTFSRRIPSLLDRYYVDGQFTGNPNLQMETDWTGVVGTQVISDAWEVNLQASFQLRKDARVAIRPSVINLGEAYVATFMGTSKWHLSPSVTTLHSMMLGHSRLVSPGVEFPYLPNFIGLLGVSWHSPIKQKSWDWTTSLRGASTQVYNVAGGRLPGYVVVDSSVSYFFNPRLGLVGRVENLLNTSYELIQGYSQGRAFSIVLAGELG